MKYFFLLFIAISAFVAPCRALETVPSTPQKNNDVEYLFRNDEKKEALQQNRMMVLIVKMIIILAITIAIALGLSFVAKKFFSSSFLSMSKNSRIHIVERKNISPKASITIVRIDDTEFCLAETQSNVTLISKMKENANEEAP